MSHFFVSQPLIHETQTCCTYSSFFLNAMSLTSVRALTAVSRRVFSTQEPKPVRCHREQSGSEQRQRNANSSHPDARHGGTGAVRSSGAESCPTRRKSSCVRDVFTVTPVQTRQIKCFNCYVALKRYSKPSDENSRGRASIFRWCTVRNDLEQPESVTELMEKRWI